MVVEPSLLRRAVVVPSVVRAPIAPFRVACLMGGLGEGGEGATVVALELAHSRELPSIAFNIAGVPVGSRVEDEGGLRMREG